MKETIKVNLGQRLFDLDTDAYNRLRNYLDSLKSYFSKSPNESEDILQDIEQRIADLLELKLSDKKQIISAEDIDEIINKMGTVEDFEMEADTSVHGSSSGHREDEKDSDQVHKEPRHLFRNIDNSMLGGVCSGMAAYFNVDVVWIRLAFVLLFFLKGAGFLAYIILWFVVPAARTTTQKLEMQGRPVNVENIKQSVKDEFHKVKENLKNASKSDSCRRIQSVSGEIFETLGSVILVILKAILVIIGIVFLFIGTFSLLGLLAIVPFNHLPHVSLQYMPYWDHFSPLMHNLSLFAFALAIVILIPIIGIITSSIRFVFNVKRHNGVLSAFSWTIWSLALVFVIVTMISGEKAFSFEEKINDKTKLKVTNNKTLLVTINQESYPSLRMAHFNIFGREILHNSGDDECYIQPDFIISSSDDSSYYMEISRNSLLSYSKRPDHYFNHDYYWQINDNTLILNKYFIVKDNEIWTVPGMNIVIKVPKGKKVIMKGEANKLFDMKEGSNDPLSSKEINF